MDGPGIWGECHADIVKLLPVAWYRWAATKRAYQRQATGRAILLTAHGDHTAF